MPTEWKTKNLKVKDLLQVDGSLSISGSTTSAGALNVSGATKVNNTLSVSETGVINKNQSIEELWQSYEGLRSIQSTDSFTLAARIVALENVISKLM